ncbi:MAG: hypothetical protein ACYS0F_01150 [Planctomycetota bacterium]|jgi:hypothetical protein
MPAEHRIALGALILLGVAMLLLVNSVQRGRKLCRRFAARFAEQYATAGSPLPGFFGSPRRHAYVRFVLQRGYESLPDADLVAAFARLRRVEVLQLAFLVAGFAGLGLAFVWLRWFRGG